MNVPSSVEPLPGALPPSSQQKGLAQPTYANSGLLCSINGMPATGCGQIVERPIHLLVVLHGIRWLMGLLERRGLLDR